MPDLEPNINPQVTAALLSTSSYIIDLVCLTIKLVESAVINGARMVPDIHGKGVIVAPMLDGRLLAGPTAEEDIAKEDTRLNTMEQFQAIGEIAKRMFLVCG
jgi:L-2-hydroxyglutarate oxidase LhgO